MQQKRGTRLAIAAAVLIILLGANRAFGCPGDCNGDGQVAVNELIIGVNISLERQPLSACPSFDQIRDARVTIDELIACVNAALTGCPRPIIRTIAGNGIDGLGGDGGHPLSASFSKPQDITVGPDGDLYIVAWNNHMIRRIRDGILERVVGTGELGDAVDGPALTMSLNHPTNVAFDAQGRMLIAAWHNSKVKRVDLVQGIATNVAGTGVRGSFCGDGGPANAACLDLPTSVVVDSNGNIIISDQGNSRLRLVEPNGIIYTIAGTGTSGYSGDGGPATLAQFSEDRGQDALPGNRIAIFNDNIYVADTGNHVIRWIRAGDGRIYTIIGNGQQGYGGDGGPAREALLDRPSDVAVDRNGNVYIADTFNHVVRVARLLGFSPREGVPIYNIDTLAGTPRRRGFGGDGGPADEALLDRPYGVEVAPDGTVYVADTHNQRIRAIIGTNAGPPPTPPPSPTPVIIPCTDVPGSICTYAGTGGLARTEDGRHRLETTFYWVMDIEFTPSGRKIVLDWNNHIVREILPDDTLRTIMGTDTVGDGPSDLSDLTEFGADPLTVNLNHPTDIQEFPNGDLLIVAWHNHKLRQISASDGRVRVLLGAGPDFGGDGGPAKNALADQLARGVLDPAGNFFFVDQRNQRIRVIYDFANRRGDAIVDTIAGIGPPPGFNGDGFALERQFSFPTGGNPEPTGGIALDANGVLYFADSFNHRIRKIEFSDPGVFKNGTVTTIAGTGEPGFSGDGGPATAAQIDFPGDIEIGPDGNLYFTDVNNNRVRMIDLSDGTIHTVAGSGENGNCNLGECYGGDGGAATEALLNRPFGIAFDANGDLYISDTFNSRIRKVKR